MPGAEGGIGHGHTGPCPICRSRESRLQYAGQESVGSTGSSAYRCTTTTRTRPAVYVCAACGHWFTNPYEWPDTLHNDYEQLEDSEYLDLLEVKRRTFHRAADVVERFVKPPAHLLEVGSYAGLFLDEMAGRGFDIEGIEPSVWGVGMSRERGHRVTQGSAHDVLGPELANHWDAVVSWDVLEHVPDPRAFISLLSSAARPGGIVVLSTLDRSNWFPRLLGKRWPWIIPMHLHYFDQVTAIAMAAACDLSFIHTTAHVHYTTPMYALRRLVRRAGDGDAPAPAASRFIVPVGFGDVRTYVFRKNGSQQ